MIPALYDGAFFQSTPQLRLLWILSGGGGGGGGGAGRSSSSRLSSSQPAMEVELSSYRPSSSQPAMYVEQGGSGGSSSSILQSSQLRSSFISFPKRIPKLESIYAANPQSNFHSVIFEDLIRQQEASERKLARKQGSLSSARADLYQILGLFFVFQGVVLTAVSQTNLLQCHDWYLPFFLSLFVSIFAFGAALQKLLEASDFQEQCRLEKVLYNALSNSIDELRDEGLDAEKEKCIPDLPEGYKRPTPDLHGRRELFLWNSKIFFVWLMSYAGAVLLLIIAFSTLTLVSVRRVLCH